MNPRPRDKTGPRGALADRLRAARKALGFTQQQAADALEVSRAWLAKVESNTKEPGPLARRALQAWADGALKRKGGRHGS